MVALKKPKMIKQSQQKEMQNLWKWPEHLFLFSEFGQPIHPNSFSQRWIRFLNKKQNRDLKKIRFHGLRHTSATLLITQGVHAKIIQERLSHSKIGTTMNTYGHVLQEAEQSAATHFESLFKK